MSALWVHVAALEAGARVSLSPDEARHVVSRRLRVGDPLVAFDAAGATAPALIERLSKRSVEVSLGEIERTPPPRSEFGLASAIPKADRLATMLPMLIQIGLETWQPLLLEESAVRKLDPDSPRLRRIGIESCKVARRPWAMRILPPASLEAVLAQRASGAALFYGDRLGERTAMDSGASWGFIGPEAGFTPGERRALEAAGARPRCLGAYNLRIETAVVAAAGVRLHAG